MFAMIEILAPFSVGIPIMILLMGDDKYSANEILGIFPLFLIMLGLIIAFCCTLNLITLPFTKHTVFLFDDHFSRGNTEVRYDEVSRIEIDSGMVSRSGASEACCLDCYSENKLLISIEHPSLWMSFLLIRRCKNAKLRYKRIKKLLLLWGFCLFLSIALGLFGAQ